MQKRLQNRVAENMSTLLGVVVFTALVWIGAGGIQQNWWPQLTGLILTTYVILETTNSNALIRVRTRIVSSTFLLFMCTDCFLFSSFYGNAAMLCFIMTVYLLFHSYQNPEAAELFFYGFLTISIGSMFSVHLLYFVPLLWLLCHTHLQSLSIRTWMASVLGLLTPYWLLLPWLYYHDELVTLVHHLSSLADFQSRMGTAGLQPTQTAVLIAICILVLFSIVHFWQKSFEDRIRTRQHYTFLGTIFIFAVTFLLLQPHNYDLLIRIIIICGSPFVAHFFTFTKSKTTNVAFILSIITLVGLTIVSLYQIRLSSPEVQAVYLWNGSSIF